MRGGLVCLGILLVSGLFDVVLALDSCGFGYVQDFGFSEFAGFGRCFGWWFWCFVG